MIKVGDKIQILIDYAQHAAVERGDILTVIGITFNNIIAEAKDNRTWLFSLSYENTYFKLAGPRKKFFK